MRTLTVAAFTTLDGVMQASGGPTEDTSGGFQFGGWLVPYADEASGQAMGELFAEPFELLLGRVTYDIFAGYWPNHPDHPIGELFNRIPKHVLTHRSESLEWNNSHTVSIEQVRQLKQQDGPRLLTQGSSEVVQQLMAQGLVDELKLMTFPVVLGKGKRLFGEGAQPWAFKLEQSSTTPQGVLIARYVRSGEVTTGSF